MAVVRFLYALIQYPLIFLPSTTFSPGRTVASLPRKD